MLGQKLVFGFHGKTLPEEFKNLLREYKIGNVILFLRNVESAEQLRALCAELRPIYNKEKHSALRQSRSMFKFMILVRLAEHLDKIIALY